MKRYSMTNTLNLRYYQKSKIFINYGRFKKNNQITT